MIHLMVDSQNATIGVVGYLRRASMTAMFGVTQAEIEFTFGVKTQPIRGIGVSTMSHDRGIMTACWPGIEWSDAAQHITDADLALFKSNREFCKNFRKAIKHELGEKSSEEIDAGQEAIYTE
jgi:hypothetical protein